MRSAECRMQNAECKLVWIVLRDHHPEANNVRQGSTELASISQRDPACLAPVRSPLHG